MKFAGKNALVTGASLGIGRAVAIKLAQQGANVAINFRSHRDQAEEVRAEIEKLGRKAILVQADVSDQKSVEGIAMVHGKASEEVDICIRKCMVEHFMLGNRLGNKLLRRNAKREISFVIFDLNFKRACLMENQFVVRICQ